MEKRRYYVKPNRNLACRFKDFFRGNGVNVSGRQVIACMSILRLLSNMDELQILVLLLLLLTLSEVDWLIPSSLRLIIF